ncbi:MAG: Protein kinase:GAF [Rhodocyclaceae bacterium]|nr:Protein kinase:GAF [Rhodocyclaceae bacterium]
MSRKIGRFEIRGELGRGAQSVVYLGFDPQLQREIAIKTLRLAGPGAPQSEQLLEEARLVGKLRHPNIVPIFQAGEEGEELYLVFEYVPGKNLAEFLQESGALPPVKAVSILQPILDAIIHAHSQGIIHRDLKPSNILLDEDGTPRVMDFGIAARVEGLKPGELEYSGTPAYMAPEYIERREISERTDIFAAGLILYEMLTGQRAIQGGNIYQVMHRIANENIVLPEGIGPVDERLSAILAKAVVRDPNVRYQTMEQFAEALDNYLDPEGEDKRDSSGKQATLDFLLRRMRHKSDFPALSESVSAINKIASSETESINKLSNSILKDFALTNKLLRLVNSAYYRPAGGGSISTVSRAVIVLGFETVRNIAITVLLFEHLQNKANANQLKEEFLRVNLAGILAKGLAAAAQMRDLEQAFICALFHNLGRLLSQYYFPEETDEIRRVMEQKECGDDQAALQVLGISFQDLGVAIARQWGFPPVIVNTMRKLDAGPVRKPVTQEDRLRVLAGMSSELCRVMGLAPDLREKEMRKVVARFKNPVGVEDKAVDEAVQHSIVELVEFARIIQLNLKQTAFGRQLRSFIPGEADVTQTILGDTLGETLLAQGDPLGYEADGATGGDGVKADAQAVLTAGIQDISNTLVDDFKLNDILRIILETMYRAMGFKRVLLCIKDTKGNAMQGRFGFGPEANELAKQFRFPLTFTPDIFHVATSKGVDILISDIDDPKIATRIPEWYRKASGAKAFVIFPLNIKNNPVALIYADKDEAGSIVIPEKELSLLRTLRNQAVLAIKQGS